MRKLWIKPWKNTEMFYTLIIWKKENEKKRKRKEIMAYRWSLGSYVIIYKHKDKEHAFDRKKKLLKDAIKNGYQKTTIQKDKTTNLNRLFPFTIRVSVHRAGSDIKVIINRNKDWKRSNLIDGDEDDISVIEVKTIVKSEPGLHIPLG